MESVQIFLNSESQIMDIQLVILSPPAWLKQIGTFFLHSRGLKGEAYGLWSGRWKMAVPAQLSVPLQGGDRTIELAVLTHSVNKHSCSHDGP